jgi:type IV pilus assembly protein PilO
VKPRKFPKPQLAIATLVGFLLVLVGGYVLVIKPQRDKAADLATQIDDAEAQLQAAQAPRVANPDLQPIRVAELFQLSRAMPDNPDVPDVLLQLSQIANETGITFKSITPSEPIVEGSYEKLPIELVFQGHFYDLSDFLYRLRNLVGVHDEELDAVGRLFSIESINFSEGEDSFPQVEANLEVAAYIFPGGTASTAATPTPGGTDTTPTETTPPAPSAAGSGAAE